MSAAKHWYLVTYDIRCPKRWRTVFKFLKAWGHHLQYSVFQVRCSKREYEEMRHRMSKMTETEDCLMFVRLCNNCAERVEIQGEPESPMHQTEKDCLIF